jgi:AcrR family transcriptional regulator
VAEILAQPLAKTLLAEPAPCPQVEEGGRFPVCRRFQTVNLASSLSTGICELGVSGPALYRYFRNRDALLTELVLDAYNDLADALTGADSLPRAYRAWALDQPHRYRLLFTAPLPGYDAHQPSLVAAAQRSMELLLRVEPDRERAVTLWSRMHGHVRLEIEGNFASIGLDPDAPFAATLA